ncbi:MAG: hypothetical protein ACFCD0_23360 [Gemmataceae bacterium]
MFERKQLYPLRWGVFLFLLTLAFLNFGCGGGGVSVKGEVKYDNQIVDQGTITFVPIAAGDAKKVGGQIKDGTYEILPEKGLSPGKYKVEIHWAKKTGRKIPEEEGSTEFMTEERKEAIPAYYNINTNLEATITNGTNSKDFDLPK